MILAERRCAVIVIIAVVALCAPLVFTDNSSALEFGPNLDVGLAPYNEDGRTASGTPGVSMTMQRDWNEMPIKDAAFAIPLHWRVNALANITRCDKEDLGASMFTPDPDLTFRGNCPERSDAGQIVTTVECNGEEEDNDICQYFREPRTVDLPGNAYIMNSREYFTDNPDMRDLYIGSQADVDRQSEQDLPVILVLQIVAPDENWVPESMRGITIENMYAVMYVRKGDYRIVVAINSMPADLQVGLTSLKIDFHPGPHGVMTTDPDGQGPEPMVEGSKSVGLLRTLPTQETCGTPHYFDGEFTSWPDKNKEEKTASSKTSVSLTGCDTIDFPFAPTIGYSPSTTQANAYPRAEVNMTRSREMSYMSGLTMRLPAGVFGSPYATPWCTPNLNVDRSEDVCPASTRAGEVEMVAALFDNEERLSTIKGQIYPIAPKSPLDLVGIGVAAKMPSIASGQIFWLESGMALYGENIDGVEASLTGMPVEFSIEKVKFAFEGSTGSASQKPLLINPSHCNPGQMSVEFASEDGQTHTSAQGFTATGCENLPYGPTASSTVSDTNVGAVPEIDIVISQAFGDAATKDATIQLPVGFEINGKTSVSPCSAADAAAHACSAGSQIGSVAIETPPLAGQIYLSEPSTGNPSSVKEIVTEIQGPAGLKATLKGELVKSPRGKGFDIALKGLPPFPMTTMRMKTFGGDKGLIVVPTVCGPYAVTTNLVSHTGRTASFASAIDVGGPRCAPRTSARIKPNKAGAKTKLSLAARPNKGEGYNSLKKVEFSLGKGKKKIKVSTGKSKRKSKKKSKKASIAKKSKKRKSKKSRTKKVGVLKLTRTTGKATKLNVVTTGKKKVRLKVDAKKCKRAKKKGKKKGKKKCKKIKGFSKLKIKVKKGRVILTGLPATPLKELKLDLQSKGKFKVHNPRKKGRVKITVATHSGTGRSTRVRPRRM